SGLGDRGSYDTLAYGLGLGLDDSWVDTTRLTAYPLGSYLATAVGEGAQSLEDLLGGWFALCQVCLVQRRNADGEVVLTVADTLPAPGGVTSTMTVDVLVTLGEGDVLINSHSVEDSTDAPNCIAVTLSAL